MRRMFPVLIALGLLVAASPAVADEPDQQDETAQQADEQADEQAGDEQAEEDEEFADDEQVADAEADEADEEDEQLAEAPDIGESDRAGGDEFIAVAPHIGFSSPQPFGDLGAWPIFGLDVGAILPFDVGGMQRPLQLGLDITYTRPGAEGQGTHEMLGEEGADYQWELSQQMLTLQLTTMWRFMPPGEQLSAHAIVGPRIYMMESILEASGNEADFGENRETNTEFGVVVGGGAEYLLGPGVVAGTLLFGGSPLDQRITGESNTSTFYLDVGYRLFF